MVNESAYILASLEDGRAKQLGQIISNEKARKILNLLTKKRATESEIAKELKIPISTVNYNIKQLLKAGLITIKGSFYSKKGNKMNVYSLAKKLILIAPKGVSVTRCKIKSILPAALITAALAGIIKLFYSMPFQTRMEVDAGKAGEFMETLPAVEEAAAFPVEVTTIISSTHYALFFLAGALIALGIYILISWRKK